jgi:hypothetical protein
MGYKSEFKGAEIDARLEKMVNVTYAELVALRDEGKLIAGQMYRMTDYDTTCTWENTQVAGHPFDLVLTALDNKTLDEKCSAIWSERDKDGYFANSNLPAWDVRYCLDNDTERFDWALMGGTVLKVSAMGQEYEAIDFGQSIVIDGITYYLWALIMDGTPGLPVLSKTPIPKVGDELYISMDGETIFDTAQVIDSYKKVGGKGVIYRLIDESENSVPYDFKNIMFMRPLTDGKYDANAEVNTFCYTFSLVDKNNYTIKDLSVEEYLYCINNKFEAQCYDNVFLQSSLGNTLGNNLLGRSCRHNTFGNMCTDNTLRENCSNNIFLGHCSNNTLAGYCSDCTFGDYCSYNILGKLCCRATLEDECSDNILGYYCQGIVLKGRLSQGYPVSHYRISMISNMQFQTDKNLYWETFVTKGKNGNIVEYTVDDIINK